MRILVTGGAGYIGSFMTAYLINNGIDVTVVDTLEMGHKENIHPKAQFLEGNLLDKGFVSKIFESNTYDAVIHFAGYIAVGESMQKPGKYFEDNILPVTYLLDAMVAHNISSFIFSSTAAVYGDPKQNPIPEDHEKNPTSPYGETKLMVEKILEWYRRIYSINFVALRYFNASGAALDGSLGEAHKVETHIIPNAIRALLGNSKFALFGSDYPTDDGTAVRDYIHVLDLAEAHNLAIKHLRKNPGGFFYNVGTGQGHSNKEVINMIQKISGRSLQVEFKERRAGDPAMLVADPNKIKTELNFRPHYSDLETIIKTSWLWHSQKGI